jgi:hypothetical protein
MIRKWQGLDGIRLDSERLLSFLCQSATAATQRERYERLRIEFGNDLRSAASLTGSIWRRVMSYANDEHHREDIIHVVVTEIIRDNMMFFRRPSKRGQGSHTVRKIDRKLSAFMRYLTASGCHQTTFVPRL